MLKQERNREGQMAGANRREALGLGGSLGLALAAAPAAASGPDDAAAAEAALRAFLRSFANCDLPAMEAAFAPDSTSFDALTAGANGALPDKASMKRAPGMPALMRRIAQTLPKERPGPPYHRPDLIQDLLVQLVGDVAICSFHFDNPDRLGRRTIVLARREGVWRILHLHASNLQL
ncbi:hypothetical protein CAP39_03960 [Sphingomonas sp. IBVSS1]|nr:hypothetical protein CAP39_03960 [Sphingomonas sp. IBVSS1]